MRFFTEHFTKHHFFHAPHKWFLALLISPIHFAEMHYQNRYRLTFVHAKKLFVFDLTLLASIIALIITAIFLFTYDPTVEKLVDLSIKTSTAQERTRSGEYLTYLIEYANRSKTQLIDPKLTLQLPSSFIIEQTEPADLFNQSNKTFSLPNLAPGSSGKASVTGLFWGNVNQEYHILTTLSYRQEKRKTAEQKLTNTITILRDSVLELNLKAPDAILSHSAVPISLILKNNSALPLANIRLPLNSSPYFTFEKNAKPRQGRIENNTWQIDELLPETEAALQLNLIAQIDNNLDRAFLSLTPIISIQGHDLLQTTASHAFKIIEPKMELNASWINNLIQAKPGETIKLSVNLKNNGAAELNDLIISLPIPAETIDVNQLIRLNNGHYKDGGLSITSAFAANLKKLLPGAETSLTIQIPIRSQINNQTDVKLKLTPKISAAVDNVPNAKYEKTAESPSIKIGTNVFLSAEARYYTTEGDQLGRGPLPPTVGEETKYWAIINIKNTTSKITNLRFSAELPNYIIWTDRSSVTHGADIFFNPDNRSVSWHTNFLNPGETAGLYLELAFTPSASQIGQTPLLLKNIRFTSRDAFTGFDVNRTAPDIDVSLSADSIGKQKGVIVQ